MRTVVVSAVLLMGAVALAGDSWQTVKLGGGSHSVAFPGKPVIRQTSFDFDGNKVPAEIAVFGAGERAYISMTADLSKYPQYNGRQNDALNAGVANLSRDKGYEIYSQDFFQIRNLPARHLVLRKGPLEQQLYAVCTSNKMIIIIVATPLGKSDNAEARKFIASFKVH